MNETNAPEDRAEANEYARRMAARNDSLMSDTTSEPGSSDVGRGGPAREPSPNQPGAQNVLASDASSLPLGEGAADRSSLERAEERIEATDAGGGLNNAAVQAVGMPGVISAAESNLPGTANLGAAAGQDLGAGLGGTRGITESPRPGEQTGAGGTRGSGAGTGDVDNARAP
ncbi:MAG: hypothetical protein M3336_16110 [Chloroflexota bacterium]|nr:hypothetical protein [Chloroflexota bacterium]